MKSIIALVFAAATMVAVAQQPPQPAPPAAAERLTPKVPDSEVGKLSYELEEQKAQKAWADMKNLQAQFQQLNSQYQSSVKDLQTKYQTLQGVITAHHDKVSKDNGWKPEDVVYEPETGTWTKAPKKPEAAKADDKK